MSSNGTPLLAAHGVRKRFGALLVLQDVDFALMNWVFNPGDFANPDGSNRPFVSVYVVTAKNEAGVLNDGSTGIMAQLAGRTPPYAPGSRVRALLRRRRPGSIRGCVSC